MLGIFPLVVAIEFLKEDIHCKDNSWDSFYYFKLGLLQF